MCESGGNASSTNTNYSEDGHAWSVDVGFWQINDYYWKAYMARRGLDIYLSEDNLEAGFIIAKTAGLGQWKASEKCWKD